MTHLGAPLQAWPVDGIGEVGTDTDLGSLISGLELADGDVVVVTSKVISKVEGRVRAVERDEAVRTETVRVVARRGPTAIVENHLGLVMAAAGVDASNTALGTVVVLPEDPDATARALRERVRRETGRNVAVLVTDTAGRAWRVGQTDLAIGAAGLEPLDDHAGRIDGYGNALAVTAPAVVDEIASMAELVTGKLGGRPVSVVRGLGERVLAPGEHGPGARSLVRPRDQDMFALGAREAVVAAVRGTDQDCFGSPASPEALVEVLDSCGFAADVFGMSVRIPVTGEERERIVTSERVRLLGHAHGWRPHSDLTLRDSITLSPTVTASETGSHP